MRKKYGKWTVLKDLGTKQVGYYKGYNGKKYPLRQRFLLVKCKCGKILERAFNSISSGASKGCNGCHIRIKQITHGLTYSAEYNIWHGMKQRCNNPNSGKFNDYGGRGIKVCKRWLNSFENFYKDMGKRPSKYHSIDRINNDGNYTPANCRWATKKQQQNNRRKSIKYKLAS